MKTRLLPILVFSIFFSISSNAQETNNYFVSEKDNNFLRNYKAPDFRFRSLTFTFDGIGQGTTTNLNNQQYLQCRSGLYFSRFFNTSAYQRGSNAALESNLRLRNNNGDVNYAVLLRGYNNSQNRFYLKNNWFYGIHAQTDFEVLAVENNNDLTLVLKPAFSIGHGRIEPIGYARVAMDVERLLIKGNRFDSNFSEKNRKELADKIAIIQTKRFFDPRLGRIYQLQALDSILQDMGVITEADITYFSLLQDAFLYGTYNYRMSGLRHEFGITQGINILPTSSDKYMSYGFYKFSYYLPKSYAVQHNFTASVIGGLLVDNTSITQNEFPLWFDVDYDFGFYPTTRSFFSVGIVGGLNVNSTVGYITGTNVRAYYYISPRFRFSLDGQFRIGENYSAHNFYIAVPNFNRVTKETSYGFRLGLIYSIF